MDFTTDIYNNVDFVEYSQQFPSMYFLNFLQGILKFTIN